MTSLNSGTNSKKSHRMNRAAILSPPVRDLIFDSAQRDPSSVSIAVTNRAPRKPAKSVGCCSFVLAVKDEAGAVFAYSAKSPEIVDKNTLFPLAPVPYRKKRACSRVQPVSE